MNVKIFILFLFIGFYPSAYCQKQNESYLFDKTSI